MEVRLAVQAAEEVVKMAGVGGMGAEWAVAVRAVAERAVAKVGAKVEAGKEVARAVAMAAVRAAEREVERVVVVRAAAVRAAARAEAMVVAVTGAAVRAVEREVARVVEACEHTQESRTGTFRRAHMVKYKRRGGCALGSCKR